jgi:tRNA pseudouridine13 synthase
MTLDLLDLTPCELRANQFWIDACTHLHHAAGVPTVQGTIKSTPGDFLVEEVLGFTPDGNGEHLFLFIEKRELNTTDVQQILSRHFRKPLLQVSFSGMKDKQAVTRQWFSVQVGQNALAEIPDLASDRIRILEVAKNSRKLRRGSHRTNKFKICIRNLKGDQAGLEGKLRLLQQQGVPNYFGPQRFGYDCNTLLQVVAWFSGKVPGKRGNTRGLWLSAARAFLFNQVLSERVASNTWNQAIEGDLMALAGTASVFAADRASADELQQRLEKFDIHPTGPLWGKGELASAGKVASLEQALAAHFQVLSAGLVREGLEQDRRPLRLQVHDLLYAHERDELALEFSLGKGSYATSVIRELIQTELA